MPNISPANDTIKALIVLLLVAAWPFANFMYVNADVAFEFWHVVGYGAGTFVFFLAVFSAVKLIFRRKTSLHISLILCAFIIALFNFDNILLLGEEAGNIRQRYSGLVWVVLTILLMWAASRFANLSKAWAISVTAAAVMFVVPTVGYVVQELAYASQSAAPSSEPGISKPLAGVPEVRPNIYIIVPDSYPRADVLRSVYGFDNSKFEAQLRARGFKVSDKSYANYYTTFLSMSSMFNMEYHDKIMRPEGATANMLETLGAFGYSEKKHENVTIGNSNFVNALKSYGYKYVFSGVFHCDDSMDYCFARSWIFIPQNLSLLTPFDVIRSFAKWHFNWDISVPALMGTPLYLELPEIMASRPGMEISPFYMYAHLMLPHAPYRFHADCSEIKEEVFVRDAFVKDAIPYFTGQVECLNSQVIAAIDEIEAQDPGANIIVQADTGTIVLDAFHTPIAEWRDEQFEEAYAILSAVKLSDSCMDDIYDSYTPVNLTRIVLTCIDGVERPRLPDISYMVNGTWELEDGQPIGKVVHRDGP
ncbi:MAG: hypothetical protein HOA58_09455 [Rhodospirillaceae bacterium]|nr:hypothetical protein [Rhodospirillaceae bacterium]MBT6829732.1 hypothetical protein [Rhodospirillaceae bacterium]